jgi:propanediol utilization protein
MHIDTDEANAAGIDTGGEGALVTGEDGGATILHG